MTDITLKVDGGFFNYRVGAIIMHAGKILMVKNSNYDYYYSVGGRVKFGETSEKAVLREAYEETHIRFEIDRLAFIHENLFAADFAGDGSFHELALFYIMKPSDRISKMQCNSLGADGGKESLHWLPIYQLKDYEIYPEFFVTELPALNKKLLRKRVKHYRTEMGKTYLCL